MYLLPIDLVKPFIHASYLNFRDNSRLLGFMPCSSPENAWANYHSVETECGRVVPVFYVPDMLFDNEAEGSKKGPALFFMGCDDGHVGIKFNSEDEALKWIKDCPYNDFELMYRDSCNGSAPSLLFYN